VGAGQHYNINVSHGGAAAGREQLRLQGLQAVVTLL
jgi:hypothetical protein